MVTSIFLLVEERDTLDYSILGGRFRNDLVRNLVSFSPTKPDKIGLGKSGW